MSPRQRWSVALVLCLLFALFAYLAPAASAAPAPKTVPNEVIIKFRPGTAASERARVRNEARGRVAHDFSFIDAEHWKLDGMSADQAIARFRNNPNVVYVEPNYEVQLDIVPNDTRFNELYAMRNTGQTGGTAGDDIKATLAWDQFTGDPNLKVGVIDTGVDYNHPDLAANVWTNPGEIPGNSIDDDNNGYVDDVHGYDFANSDGDPFDDNGHGSHCSGTIAGMGNNNLGVVGVCWQAKIVGIKFLSGSGSGSTAGAIAGLQYAIAIGVRLTSNSWGGGGFSQGLLDAINAAGAANQLFVAAAGNSSANTDTSPHYPSAYNSPYIVSVAATDHNDNLASFSNYGATTVDLAAPGVSILSTLPGNSYGLLSGTSMATPHVSGAVALAMGRFPAVSNLQIKSLLLNAVDVKASLNGKVLTNGRLNAFMTIAEPDDTPPGSVADLSTSNPASNSMQLDWTATGDDGNTGRATSYQIRYSTSPITEANFAAATLATSGDPLSAGSHETTEIGGLDFNTTYFFAIKAFDEFNNAGGLSNVAMGTTLGIPDIAASPAGFSAELLTGAIQDQALTLQNLGEGTLDFVIPTPELAFSQPAPYPYQPLSKGQEGDAGPPVVEATGGPDGFGYRWMDSDEPGGPAFSWLDITGSGTPLALTGDDATSAAVPLGFDFPYYGTNFNSLRVCTNGWLSFSSTATAYDNQMLPNSGAPTDIVAPFWDDLDFGATQRVYTYGDGTKFVISWVGVPRYQEATPNTFQAILYPTGEIRFQYLSMGPTLNSATTGIQNGSRTIGLTVAHNTAYVKDNHAVRIFPLSQWLTVTPTSGRILAGNSQAIQVRFNALGLNGGTFAGTVRVLSNDPDETALDLPASLHVIGAPDMAVSPPSLDFGTVFAGASPTKTVTVSNPGTDNLIVSSITSDDASVTASPASFTLAPLAAQAVTLTWHPTAPMTLAATLTVASNDPDAPTATVAMIGSAVPAPSFAVDPTSYDVSLLTNTATTRSLRVSNSGGSNYVFTAEAMVIGPTGSVTVGSDADNVFVDKGMEDVQSGPMPLKAGGPDVFGYTYKDSDELDGPAFAWVDITGVGTRIAMTGDDANTGPFPIGFDFPFYGKSFNTFRVCTNGWVSFSSNKTTFSNTTLPNTGSTVPENMLAAFWDDLHFDTAQKAYYYNDGTRFIVSYVGVRRVGESATTNPNTFQIILYPNGTIVYQYLTMSAATKTSATIGIQNEARNDGLQVVFNATYMKNNLAVRFRPPARFLTVSPASGTVPPGGFMDLTVGFNAADLFGGDYTGAVRLQGNDPVLPRRDVPAVLHVTGVPDVTVNPTTVDFGNTYIGFPAVRQVTVRNAGTDALTVSGITLSNPLVYGVDNSSFTIPAQGQALLTVSFNPNSPGPAPATMTIASNDPDTPSFSVPLSGAGVVPPDISTSPASMTSTLPIPATETQTVTVNNTGGSDLTFVVGTSLTATSVQVHDAVELGKDEIDTREGVLGTGGPDMFGYTWRDSDDPSGPAYDWVDITGIGTPLALTGDDANLANVPIGFSFPYYGGSFSSVNVCTNGWLSFTSTATALTNSALPSNGSGVPENLLAAFWDDLNPGSTQRVYTYRDGTRFIVSYIAVPRYSTGGPYTFQVILYPSGRIVYQYQSMQGTRLNEATIGVQNATRDDGLTVVFNAAYMHDNLAIEFRTVPDWMTASPTSGTIPAGGSAAIDVTFNSAELFGGTYNGSLRLTTNDPDEGAVQIPATLTALGVPHVAADPASLDFGTIYVGQTTELPVTLRNSGNDVLTISGIASTQASFALVGAPSFPITLGNHGAVNLTVRFAPTSAWYPPNPCMGELVVASNDPNGDYRVGLQGAALVPPEAEVSPASVRAALATTLGPTAIAKTKTVALRNSGGSDLVWSARALSLLPAAINSTPSAETGKDQKGEPGGAAALASGGPDAFGYRYADSDDPIQGTPFDWVDITSVGTPIPFTGDDQNQGPFPLPFPFTYYGNTYTEFRACTNGWISFTSTVTAFNNSTLPNTTAPENIIAPFWEDLTFSSTGDVYYHYDGTKFIISYVNVPRLTSGGPYTFQILLYPSGTIDFQYLSMNGTRLNEATVGIQNQPRDIGLQVAYNQTYVKNNLRVRFTAAPGWLTVTPNSGVVPAGGETPLQVGFNATGQADGDYSGIVRIDSNDLTDPVVDVEASMHVGVVAAVVDIDPNSLNRSANGTWVVGTIEPPAGFTAQRILKPSVLLQRQVPVAASAPVSYDDKDGDGLQEVAYKFDRTLLSALLPVGASVPVEAIGEVEDETWFSGTDLIRVLKPRMISSMGLDEWKNDTQQPHTYFSGSRFSLAWDDPEGYPAQWYDLWFSDDGGESWYSVANQLTTRTYDWLIRPVETTNARLELVAMDGAGAMGSWQSEPFTVVQGNVTGIGDEDLALPTELGMRLTSANPMVQGNASFRLAVPTATPIDVRVFDINGRVVRNVTSRTLAAGYHTIGWDGRGSNGRPVGSGVYFVRMTAAGKVFTNRLAVVR